MIINFPLRVGGDILSCEHPEWPDFYRKLKIKVAKFGCLEKLDNTESLLREAGFNIELSIKNISGSSGVAYNDPENPMCDCYIIFRNKEE